MSTERKPFGEVFNDNRSRPLPLCQVRRMTRDEIQKYQVTEHGTPVGLFYGPDLVAQVDFDDLFDADGNRFYND
jgi:hypothetical protein